MPTNLDASLELYKTAVPFSEVYQDYDLSTLPSWLRENIAEARVYGGNNRCVILPDGRKYHLDNSLNDVDGRTWTLFINSVFSTHYPTNGKEGFAHHIRKIHPSPKPPQLMRDLISFFTKETELVFDSFAGVGGTLLGAALCNRQAIGVELNPLYINAYKAAAEVLQLEEFPVVEGDCLSFLRNDDACNSVFRGREIALYLIDPPYSNMMSRKKTGGDIAVYGKTGTPFSDSNLDLGNMETESFLHALRESVELVLPRIKKRGYIVVFIKDLQPSKKTTNLLHAAVIDEINKIPNVFYKGMKIWADQSTKPYPYGYPFCFVANQIHQYILVFRKEK